jgi:hypothetical protein
MDAILKAATKAFDPKKPKNTKAIEEFNRLIEKTPTLTLLNALNRLMKSSTTPPWVRSKVKEALSLVPLRPDGVRGTLEVVASVHPSSTVKASEAAVPQKKGANITQEALKDASGVISAPPSTTTPKRWYTAIGPQLLALLDGDEGLDLARAAAYIIGFSILGKPKLGAPGTPLRCPPSPLPLKLTRVKVLSVGSALQSPSSTPSAPVPSSWRQPPRPTVLSTPPRTGFLLHPVTWSRHFIDYSLCCLFIRIQACPRGF